VEWSPAKRTEYLSKRWYVPVKEQREGDDQHDDRKGPTLLDTYAIADKVQNIVRKEKLSLKSIAAGLGEDKKMLALLVKNPAPAHNLSAKSLEIYQFLQDWADNWDNRRRKEFARYITVPTYNSTSVPGIVPLSNTAEKAVNQPQPLIQGPRTKSSQRRLLHGQAGTPPPPPPPTTTATAKPKERESLLLRALQPVPPGSRSTPDGDALDTTSVARQMTELFRSTGRNMSELSAALKINQAYVVEMMENPPKWEECSEVINALLMRTSLRRLFPVRRNARSSALATSACRSTAGPPWTIRRAGMRPRKCE